MDSPAHAAVPPNLHQLQPPGTSDRRISTSFKDSKFAQILGFGFFGGESAPPVIMGQPELDADTGQHGQTQSQGQGEGSEVVVHRAAASSTPAPASHRLSNPLEPSYYQIGMRIAQFYYTLPRMFFELHNVFFVIF